MSEQSETEEVTKPSELVFQTGERWNTSRLIPILAVLGVALVLGSILVPNYLRARTRSSFMTCRSNLRNIGTAIEMYSEEHKGEIPTALGHLTPNYLLSLPECPGAGRANYVLSVGKDAPMNTSGDDQYYFIACQGENHTGVAITGDYPAYSSVDGLIERAP